MNEQVFMMTLIAITTMYALTLLVIVYKNIASKKPPRWVVDTVHEWAESSPKNVSEAAKMRAE